MTKIEEEKTAEKNYLFLKFAMYLSLGLLKGHPSYRRSLKPSKENIQHFKKMNFINFFYIFVGHICPPGSGTEYGSGFATLLDGTQI
jgi:hypothetical protein